MENSGNTQYKMETGKEDACLYPLLTGGFNEAHSTLRPGSGEAGFLHRPLPGRNSKTALKPRILIFFHLYFLTGRKQNEHKLRHTLRFRVKMQHHRKGYNNKKSCILNLTQLLSRSWIKQEKIISTSRDNAQEMRKLFKANSVVKSVSSPPLGAKREEETDN